MYVFKPHRNKIATLVSIILRRFLAVTLVELMILTFCCPAPLPHVQSQLEELREQLQVVTSAHDRDKVAMKDTLRSERERAEEREAAQKDSLEQALR